MEQLSGFNTTLQNVEDRYQWINEMIRSRQKLVVAYMKLLNLPCFAEHGAQEATAADVTAFCEDVIDYVSHGHFDLYPKIIALIEKASGRSLSIATRVLPRIEKTTDFLMRFSDSYTDSEGELSLEGLKRDLEQVGKCLEQRFKNEDRLIIGLRLVHSMA